MKSKFTESVRGRITGGIRAGRPLEDALDGTGVSRSTFHAWMRRGAMDSEHAAGSDYARFRGDVEAARAGSLRDGLSVADLVGLLEGAARRGSVQAMKLLLERPWERGDGRPRKRRSAFDSLDEGDELAKRRRRGA